MQSVVNDMLKNIPDPKARQIYGDILSGKIVKQVRCLSKACKGRVIAYIDDKNNCKEHTPLIDKKSGSYKSGLSSSRLRLDGNWGFHCYCGNRSILAKEERGVIGVTPPSKKDLEELANRFGSRRATTVGATSGKLEVDGFRIEEVK